MSTMQAVVFEADRGPVLAERPAPGVNRPDDVLVRIAATGICGTDRGIALGQFPATSGVIMGHEAVGAVAEIGSAVNTLEPGMPVVINPTYFCGNCARCLRGMQQYCGAKEGMEVGVDRDGTMTDHVLLPQGFVHPLPSGVCYERGVLVEPLACVLNNLDAAGPRADDRVLVLGAGPIGALCALVLSQRGFRVAVQEQDPVRAEFVRGVVPETVEVLPGTFGTGLDSGVWDLIIDTTGVLLAEAFHAVAEGGTVLVMGEREGAIARIPARPLATRGIRLIGAGPYSPQAFGTALDLATHLLLESLVSHTFPIQRYTEAFSALAVPSADGSPSGNYAAMKVLLLSDRQLLHRPPGQRSV